MENLTESSADIVEFLPYNQGNVLTEFANTSSGTDELPVLLDKSSGTNPTWNVGTQTHPGTGQNTPIDNNKLALFLKKVCPMVEKVLIEGPTPVGSFDSLTSNENDDECTVQPYQKVSLQSKEYFQGLATWLSVYTDNTPLLVLATAASHDDWCEHVDQTIKVFIPKRVQSGTFISFEELTSMPTKGCLVSLSTNCFDKDIFAGSTVSGDLYVWKFVSNKSGGNVDELFSETLENGSVVDFGWPGADRMLTCHSNGWVCLWVIGTHLLKEGDFLVSDRQHRVLELTTVVSVSATDFMVGCVEGGLYYCSNSNMGAHKSEIEVTPMKRHKFEVTGLYKKEVAPGKRLIVSSDLSGEVFFHDLLNSDEVSNARKVSPEGPKTVLRIPLPFQNNIDCSKDGKIIFCPGMNGSLELYRDQNRKHSTVKGVLQGKGNMVKVSDNGLWVVTGAYCGDFQIFRIRI